MSCSNNKQTYWRRTGEKRWNEWKVERKLSRVVKTLGRSTVGDMESWMKFWIEDENYLSKCDNLFFCVWTSSRCIFTYSILRILFIQANLTNSLRKENLFVRSIGSHEKCQAVSHWESIRKTICQEQTESFVSHALPDY